MKLTEANTALQAIKDLVLDDESCFVTEQVIEMTDSILYDLIAELSDEPGAFQFVTLFNQIKAFVKTDN